MFLKVFRDPGGSAPVRVIADVDVVNGSKLIVPADTVAVFARNGIVSSPFGPGTHILDTGVHPFFVRFRNVMTRGDAGITCQLFFVNNVNENVRRGGTGDILYLEKRFNITMRVRAAYTARFVIKDPSVFVSRLVGMHNTSFTGDAFGSVFDSMLLPVLRSRLAEVIAPLPVHDIQIQIASIGNMCSDVRRDFESFGIDLRLTVMTLNLADEDLKKLEDLENKSANGRLDTALEADNIRNVYDGDINKRTMAELLSGAVRGPGKASFPGGPDGGGSMANSMLPILQFAIAAQAVGNMAQPLQNMFGSSGSVGQAGTGSSAGMNTGRFCPSCGNLVAGGDVFCKHCGHRL
ncbi:MAG: SPFH domain-containing protein [Lachnospiraceae bacterium]|nr:SPFH domain-containing protein [Lachnospiraceae bacterium]